MRQDKLTRKTLLNGSLALVLYFIAMLSPLLPYRVAFTIQSIALMGMILATLLVFAWPMYYEARYGPAKTETA